MAGVGSVTINHEPHHVWSYSIQFEREKCSASDSWLWGCRRTDVTCDM
jgi:hypothetical protein